MKKMLKRFAIYRLLATIKILTKRHGNDQELGAAVRSLFS
jgi:hypothetical protein